MNDLGKQICRCIVGACDDTCKYYDAEKACCVGYDKVAEQAEKVFAEYENYKKLEEQGKLLKLPVAVGDTVYIVSRGKILPLKVLEVQRFLLESELVTQIKCTEAISYGYMHFLTKEIGETIFLTPKAAEAALKEMSKE